MAFTAVAVNMLNLKKKTKTTCLKLTFLKGDAGGGGVHQGLAFLYGKHKPGNGC